MSVQLLDLLGSLKTFEPSAPLAGVGVEAVTADSRLVKPGSVFVAVPGTTVDGHSYVAEAVARGAVAVVGSGDLASQWAHPVPYIRVPDPRQALAVLAAASYGFPSRRLALVGVTGTDGKTTTANLIYHLGQAVGRRPGVISTVGARLGQRYLDTGLHVTTPEAADVQRYLADMVEAGCDLAILEATSHGLHQGRVAACDFDVAVVTNVTHEHLDYHGSWEAYLDAKASLFRALSQSARKPGWGTGSGQVLPKTAVLNADDPSYSTLRAIPADQHLAYSIDRPGADVRAEDIRSYPDGMAFSVRTPVGNSLIRTNLVGLFNVQNALAAMTAGLALGLTIEQIAAALEAVEAVDGRMERVDQGQDFLAMVDFAHTPASLSRALEAVRSMVSGRIIAVLGSAGLRDVQKRALMAEIAVQRADLAVLTAEDPRTESLDHILSQMVAGAVAAGAVEGRDFVRVADRAAAIQLAVDVARSGDAVLVCGKGHERSMCFGRVEYPWRDQDVVAWALARRLGEFAGPPPFSLPTTVGTAAQKDGT